jgi:hypothetical protein
MYNCIGPKKERVQRVTSRNEAGLACMGTYWECGNAIGRVKYLQERDGDVRSARRILKLGMECVRPGG